MLKEICVTPHVFDCEHIDGSSWKDIKNLLENISKSGFIVGLNNKDWKKVVLTKINQLDPKIKGNLSVLLAILADRDRIVGHPKEEGEVGANEDDWFHVAEKLNAVRDFYRIITAKSYGGRSTTVEQLDGIDISEEFGLTGSVQRLKTAENLHKMLLPFLSYSKKVTIIDPYFHLDLKRYVDTINIVAKCFRERRGRNESGCIIIHCKWNEDKSEYVKKWQKEMIRITKDYSHTVKVFAWAGIDYELKLHDRYFITNQSGLVSAAGTDVDNRQNSEWSIKYYEELSDVLSQYKENSSPFILKCAATASSVEYY